MIAFVQLLLPAVSAAYLPQMARSAVRRTTDVTMGPPTKKIALGIVGTGLVGGEFLEQLESTRDKLAKQGLEVIVASISKTKPDKDGERQPWMLCDDEEGCTLESVAQGICQAKVHAHRK